ncbi:unnamed protein product [Haemonchus placei]|uniref:Uncharacterized protein n=1 Tax=Haemonchus placei TaxID=6290 RepID=A0A0N4X0Q6_HAEPC|nr:unnamed protein product [Haemonchus placei]
MLPLQLLIYALYRVIRTIIFIESDLYTLVRKLLQHEKTGNVEFFNILTRFRLDPTDIAQDHDFLIFNDGFGIIEDLIEPCWMIYTITERYVYFVRIPYECSLSISTTSRLTALCYNSADKLARMDIGDFLTETKSRIDPSRGRVVILHSSPCCGGSMLGRLLSSVDVTESRLLVLGEPPVLTALAVLAQYLSIETMRSITAASLRFSMRDIEMDQVVVMKARSCCAKIVPYVHVTMPSIQHLFITARDPTVAIPRLLSSTSQNLPALHMACNLLSYSPAICDFFTCWRLLESEMIQKIGPKADFEFALAQIMGCIISYQRNLKYYALEVTYAEDLLNDPLTVIRPILDVCGMSHMAVTDHRAWKLREETAIQSQCIAPLDDIQRQRVKLLVEYLQQDWCR